jgi:hypothetical protein
MVWDLALADMPALDRYESVAAGLYVKVQQSIITGAGPRRALVYVGRNAGPGRPRPGYMDDVVAAGREAALPDAYLRELDALVPGAATRHVVEEPSRKPPEQSWRPAVTPTRSSPLEPVRARATNWKWEP